MPNSPDEIAALRDEVEALRAQLAEREHDHGHGDGDGGSPPRRGGWWRAPLVGVLLALVAILSPLSVVAAWAHAEVSSTDRYVNTVTPLATHPAIQDAIIDRVTSEIFARIDIPRITDEAIDALAAQGIPSTAETGLRALAVPLDNAVQNFVREQVTRLVESQAFEDAWIAANRQAHEQLVAVLTGEGTGDVDVSGGTVSVNLAALIDTVKQTLVDRGFNLVARLPTINASFVIFESADLTRAQSAFDLLDKMSTILPILTLILLAVAVAVARNRRRTVIAGFLCIAFGMILLGLALAVFRSVYLDAIPTDQIPTSAAAAVYDTLVGLIRMNIRGILFVALIVAFVAWVSGPTATATQLRGGSARAIAAVREHRSRGFETGGLGRTLWTYRVVIRIGVVSLAALILLLNNPITGIGVITAMLIVGVVLLVVELLSSPPHETAEPADTVAAG